MPEKSSRDASIERMAEVMREFMARAVLFQDAVDDGHVHGARDGESIVHNGPQADVFHVRPVDDAIDLVGAHARTL